MKSNKSNLRLVITALIALASFIFIELFGFENAVRTDSLEMKKAAHLCAGWFDLITKFKIEKRVLSPEGKNIKYGGLIGQDFSLITTTLGSLESKKLSLNPEYAALIYKWFHDLKIDSTASVGINCSASFPALTIATLAAAQLINAKVILFSSLGSSTYGANDSNVTWLDIENYLRSYGGLKYSSMFVSYGGEDDNGLSIYEGGIPIMEEAIRRNKTDIFKPASLDESIEKKYSILINNNVKVFVNIGGNQASLGKCAHSSILPNGIIDHVISCNHQQKGLLLKINELGIPVINLLEIKSIALKYNLINSGSSSGKTIYYNRRINYQVVILLSIFFVINLFLPNLKDCKYFLIVHVQNSIRM